MLFLKNNQQKCLIKVIALEVSKPLLALSQNNQRCKRTNHVGEAQITKKE